MSNTPPFIAGNWKMHMTLAETNGLVSEIIQAAPGLQPARLIVFPPFTALCEAARLARATFVGVGGQDLFWEDKGAFTGEISALMLKDAGCTHVIVGHSERRQFFGETDETVNRKVRAALSYDISPILCVGESLEERDGGTTMARIKQQLDRGLLGVSRDDMNKILIAYEPIWAIGTGKTAGPSQAEEVHGRIRMELEEKYGNETAACVIILYGGSVKSANAYSLFKEKNIDGFLVGGASLEAGSFIRIAKEALRAYEEKK